MLRFLLMIWKLSLFHPWGKFIPCWAFEICVYSLQGAEQNRDDTNVEEQNGEDGSQEEAVVVDADSTDGAVLVNGNEAEEEWGTNNEGTPSA